MGVPNGYTSAQVVQAVPVITSSALTYIGQGTLSGSSTTFSSVFSATYNNYLITADEIYGTSQVEFGLQIGGVTSADYSYGTYRGQNNTSAGSFYNVWNGSATATDIRLGNAYSTQTNSGSLYLNIVNPFRALETRVFGTFTDGNDGFIFQGSLKLATSYTSFTLLTASSSFNASASNIVRFYGYANS